MSRTIDRTRPLYRDDPVIARLTDEQVWALAELVARMAASYAGRLEAEGVAVEDIPRRLAQDANAPPGADIRTARPAGAGRGAHRREND
jgi:hypothetical protein